MMTSYLLIVLLPPVYTSAPHSAPVLPDTISRSRHAVEGLRSLRFLPGQKCGGCREFAFEIPSVATNDTNPRTECSRRQCRGESVPEVSRVCSWVGRDRIKTASKTARRSRKT